ncbi:tyrosine decarboxylase-like [Schistocerca serialis cubense]|uniref:tyrosine decarboxylase-like n=1 Tax=Schistocerca serialis cubense TaxID=2023355 RepID=UPI00214EAA48|nr:tyrosine decarboxylase-like [Schistocerca serialis cubense]
MLAARYQMTKGSPRQRPPTVPTRTSQRQLDDIDETVDRLRMLTAYCSTEAHCSVQKAARLCMVQLRVLDADRSDCLSAERLRRAIEADVDKGFVPFYVVATIGTYATAASDNLKSIGAVCQEYPTIWLHVDASYGGNALLCPEMRHLSLGIEYANSISVCPEKWALVNHDCTCFWTSDYLRLIEGLVVNPTYLQYEQQNESIDYRHWGVPLSRRFRALKLWFTLRSYGLHNLQKHIRNHCLLAERFRAFVNSDRRLQLMNLVEIRRKCKCRPSNEQFPQLGVVCFRVLRTGESQPLPADQLTELLLAFINQSGRAFMSPVRVGDNFCIRYCITAENYTHEDVDRTARTVERCLEKIEHAQYVSITKASLVSLGVESSAGRLSRRSSTFGRTRRRSGDSHLQLRALRYLTHTVSVPPAQLQQMRERPMLQGGGSPYFVPSTDDDIVDHVDLSDLVASLEL